MTLAVVNPRKLEAKLQRYRGRYLEVVFQLDVPGDYTDDTKGAEAFMRVKGYYTRSFPDAVYLEDLRIEKDRILSVRRCRQPQHRRPDYRALMFFNAIGDGATTRTALHGPYGPITTSDLDDYTLSDEAVTERIFEANDASA